MQNFLEVFLLNKKQGFSHRKNLLYYFSNFQIFTLSKLNFTFVKFKFYSWYF
jgi:hypothetical protein